MIPGRSTTARPPRQRRNANAGRTREQDAERKRRQTAARRVVEIPACQHRRRREYLEARPPRWLRWYFPHIFSYEFTEQQRHMIDALVAAIRHGGDQALAASRGEGKTTICECVLAWALLSGVSRFVVLFSATGTDAELSLETWKGLLTGEDCPRLLQDYPEVCVPIQALENTPNRAHFQLVQGRRHDNGEHYGPTSSKFSWTGRKVTLPRVPGSPAAAAIFATRGLEGSVRGLKVGRQRPDVAVIDDPDTEDTVNNPGKVEEPQNQAAKLVRKLEQTIAGLAGQKKSIARVMLTTLQKAECVSAWFTDPSKKPSWTGRRYRFLVKPPDNPELWEEYVHLWRASKEAYATGQGDDEHNREAHRYYLANREKMDAGAEVANPNRFNPEVLEDGSQTQVSALQAYFDLVARLGAEAVQIEYDNDPPPELGPQDAGLTAYRVQHQVSGYERRQIPPTATLITAGIDCRKIALHWVVRAWEMNGTGYQIDYGVQEVRGTIGGSDEGVDLALRRAILERMDDWKDNPYTRQNGEALPIKLALVDAGWRTEAVYLATQQWGLGLSPAMGFGKSGGCAAANFNPSQANTATRRSGDGWFFTHRPATGQGVWLAALDADRWKNWEHDRWLTEPGNVGALTNYGDNTADPNDRRIRRRHFAFAKHITAESEVEDIKNGALVTFWRAKSDTNHWLDAAYMANAAANMVGVKLLRTLQQAPTSPQSPTGPATPNLPQTATQERPPMRQPRPRQAPRARYY